MSRGAGWAGWAGKEIFIWLCSSALFIEFLFLSSVHVLFLPSHCILFHLISSCPVPLRSFYLIFLLPPLSSHRIQLSFDCLFGLSIIWSISSLPGLFVVHIYFWNRKLKFLANVLIRKMIQSSHSSHLQSQNIILLYIFCTDRHIRHFIAGTE
jgi:hypothetical protein